MSETKQEALEKRKKALDQFAVSIEFLLISVVQGAALAALATYTAIAVDTLRIATILYITASFLIILNFWSQAIIHTLSFIDWPLDMIHNFLYFLIAFIEIIAFAHITNPLAWFGFMSLFFLAAGLLYLFDLHLIRMHEKKFDATESGKTLYRHIIHRELFEAKILVPLAILYTLGCFLAIYFFPNLFLIKNYQIALIGIQVSFASFSLYDSVRNFNTRTKLIANSL